MSKYINLFPNDKLTKASIDYDAIDESTIQILAQALLTKYVIVVGTKEFRICEIEFYVRNENHNDEYTHGDAHQKTYGKWYFHRYPNGSYKSGTYKGVDLTLGNANTYFGILIRSMYDEETDEMIEGPCKIVNKILELNSVESGDVKGYMEGRLSPLNARSTKNFYIKRRNLESETIYKGPRIGLSDKYPEWKNVNYRFVIKKDYIKKDKKNLIEL